MVYIAFFVSEVSESHGSNFKLEKAVSRKDTERRVISLLINPSYSPYWLRPTS
jgi:hypothetical protein